MAIEQPWGKFDATTGDKHHLAHHCADVAACFLGLARMSVFRARLEWAAGRALSETDIERLGVLLFLHDVGKLHPGFQAKGWPSGIWRGALFGHVREGLDIFLSSDAGHGLLAAKALHIDRLAEWGVDQSLLRAVLSHHGRPAPSALTTLENFKTHWIKVQDYDPHAAAVAIGAAVKSWFPVAFSDDATPLPDAADFQHLISGLTALADWVGSDADKFRFVAELDANYWAKAACRAAKALSAIGLDTFKQRAARMAPATFCDVSGYPTPNPQQHLVGETDLKARLVILEAETGSGKTEAALWRYIQLFETRHVDGLYFAVPTRAAAAQLHRRVTEAGVRLFGDADPQAILAVPGYVRAGSVDGQKLPHWRVLWDDTTDADILAARWASEHSKRYLAAQIAVGTVDQAMLGALKVKHAHLRASSMSRNLLVIDEVHASDRFMTAIQKRLLDAHLAVGGYAMLMSATLGSSARAQWLGRAQPTFDAAVATPYPAVWTDIVPTPRSPCAAPARPKSVEMELLSTMAPEVTVAQALTAARNGARVLVIRNTVGRAVESLQALEAQIEPSETGLLFTVQGVPTLHHSRFAPTDRRRLDAAVEDALKPDVNRAAMGKIIIGSQTLEQSLDIDADILITDLCPVDVLLQRIGRLHRHSLPRPVGFKGPRCMVMVPERGLAPLLAPQFENGLGAWKRAGVLEGVYRDLCILELTCRLVGRHAVWNIPAMNRFLVESGTHPTQIDALIGELGSEWKRYNDDIIGSELAKAGGARGIMIDRRQPFEELTFPQDGEERIRTRLGEEGARIAFEEPFPMGPFGEPITEIVLPAHLSGGITPDAPVVVVSRSAREFTFNAGDRSFKYGRFGVQ